MTLMAAMCIFTTIYGDAVCDVDPGFPNSPLALALAPHGITEATWNHHAGRADRAAHEQNRHYPGSGDHLVLESAIDNDPLTLCPKKQITNGTNVQLQLRSMNGVYDTALGAFLVDFILTGSPPGPSVSFPELQVDLGRVIFTPFASLSSPQSLGLVMPFTLPGGSFLVQGVALQASGETGNPAFTTTDAHELVFY